MDPLSILSLVEACAGLALTAGKLAISLKRLADNYKQAALTFRSLSSQCKLFATSVRAIQAWMEEAPEVTTLDNSIWEQLADSLECANDAIYALEKELVSSSGSSVNTFWNKANVVWNLQCMRDLEDCIHKQICSLSVILQIMNLPTRKSQTSGLEEQSSVFQESRSFAMSLRDAETSTLKGGADAASTIRAPSSIATNLSQLRQFDFDEMLLTSRVYLRNLNETLVMNDSPAGGSNVRGCGTSGSERPLELSPDVQYRLEKLDRLEVSYRKLLKAYRVAYARATVLATLEGSLRESTSLTSFDDPKAFVDFLRRATAKSDIGPGESGKSVPAETISWYSDAQDVLEDFP